MNTQTPPALQILKNKLEETKLRNPNWSMRAFAQRLGLSSGALSEILSGKRALSVKVRRRMIAKLQLSPLEQRQFLTEEFEPLMTRPEREYLELNSDAFHLISDWWHYALLNLLKTTGFRAEVPWMARRLGLAPAVVKEAWQRLFRLKYLEKTARGITRRHPKLKTTDDVADLSLRRSHVQGLKLIEEALLDVPVEAREVSSATLVIKMKDIPRAKAALRKLMIEFCDLVESDLGDEVYQLTIAFTPLTKIKGENS